ncbi:MAG: V-type ATPase subunit [Oscillospiraceae bacterium]|nr:V-type ATPase subunit [Oscillospiraceae bacterium]
MATKKEAYLCVSAMLRAREPKLLNAERAHRMLDAASFEDAAKILTDCGYPDMSHSTAGEVEEMLAAHRAEIFDELSRLSPDKELADLFKLKYDYHNAKAIVKAEAVETDPKRLLSDAGRIPGAQLLELYHEERWSQLPPVLAKAMEEARGVLARTANPQLSDFVLDRAYFEELRALADRVDSDYLRGYVQVLADSTNLKSAVRTLRMGKSRDFLQEVLVDGGSIDARRVAAASDKDALAALYVHTPLEKAAVLGGEALAGGGMTAFERACDNAVNDYLKKTRLISYGPEAVVAYLAAVEGEIQAVRMILTGRLAGVKAESIRERLRDLYA